LDLPSTTTGPPRPIYRKWYSVQPEARCARTAKSRARLRAVAARARLKRCSHRRTSCRRDWGHADFVRAWLILQQHQMTLCWPRARYSVRQFGELAFAQIGRNVAWKGSRNDEIGFDRAGAGIGQRSTSAIFAPGVDELLGDASRARGLGGGRRNEFQGISSPRWSRQTSVIPQRSNAVAR
jgi:hypothetical protein